MDILRLICGLVLPWAAGYFWLAAMESRYHAPPVHRFRQMGYAYFIGLMILFGIVQIQTWLYGAPAYGTSMAVMSVFTLAGWLVYRNHTGTRVATSPTETRLQRTLFWFFTAWCLVHLALVAIEVWHRPVFPWDAWQTWMYRAKAWFLAGSIFTMDNPLAWEHGTNTAEFNTYGAGYPAFISVIAYWAALSLGQWHEALVNLPTLFCGIALAMALYGLTREVGLSRWVSALSAYLLLSIPLLGTHLALAGQADVWQSAFTGLGLAALLWGVIAAQRWYIGLGLLMTFLGCLVKNEGTIWFIAALAFLAVLKRPRHAAYAATGALLLLLLAWLTGFHYLEIPGVGKLGVADNRVHLLWLGGFRVMTFDLWEDYRANFFESSTWHLLWPMIILATIGLGRLPHRVCRNAIITLFVILVLTQLVVFGISEHGYWAEDWTAINRLPLHIAPTAILALLLVFRGLSDGGDRVGAGSRHWLAPTLGLLITAAASLAYLAIAFPATDGTPRQFSPQHLSNVVGSGQPAGQSKVIDGFEHGIALLSSRRTIIDPARLPVLEVETGGENRAPRRFFWRNGPGEDDLHSIEIDAGHRLVHLGASEHWRRTVSEVGLLFHEDDNRPADVSSLVLRPRTLGAMLSMSRQDWSSVARWDQKSVHFITAGDAAAPLKLPIVLGLWIAVTACISLVLVRYGIAPYTGIALAALLGWLLLDVRWTRELVDQASKTIAYYKEQPASHLDMASDRELLSLASKAGPFLPSQGRILIVAEADGMDFEALRVKYHLLPRAAHVRKGMSIDGLTPLAADYVLLVRTRVLPPGQSPATPAHFIDLLKQTQHRDYETIFDDPAGVLLQARQ